MTSGSRLAIRKGGSRSAIRKGGSRLAIRKGGSRLAIRKSTEITLTWEQSPGGAARPQTGVKPLLVSFMGDGNPDGVTDNKTQILCHPVGVHIVGCIISRGSASLHRLPVVCSPFGTFPPPLSFCSFGTFHPPLAYVYVTFTSQTTDFLLNIHKIAYG